MVTKPEHALHLEHGMLCFCKRFAKGLQQSSHAGILVGGSGDAMFFVKGLQEGYKNQSMRCIWNMG